MQNLQNNRYCVVSAAGGATWPGCVRVNIGVASIAKKKIIIGWNVELVSTLDNPLCRIAIIVVVRIMQCKKKLQMRSVQLQNMGKAQQQRREGRGVAGNTTYPSNENMWEKRAEQNAALITRNGANVATI